MRSESAACRLFTISRARALASGENADATYALPSASPSARSVTCEQRFQRVNGWRWPVSTDVNEKFSLKYAVLSQSALPSSTCHVRYAFQSASGADATLAAAAFTNSGCDTSSVAVGLASAGTPVALKNATQSMPGASFVSSATDILW